MKRKNMPIVLAGNYAQYKSWCWENGVHERDALYVRNLQSLRGLSGVKRSQIRYAEGSGGRPDFYDLCEYVEFLISTGTPPLTDEQKRKNLVAVMVDRSARLTLDELADLAHSLDNVAKARKEPDVVTVETVGGESHSFRVGSQRGPDIKVQWEDEAMLLNRDAEERHPSIRSTEVKGGGF